ncbi:MAG: hypothetical protein ABWX68_14090 [Arthrobacter sp.]|uniref:hypothetical protein n=1 Tax=Arthrobacter sp. TaxID=1667 RepID=UPI00347C37D3
MLTQLMGTVLASAAEAEAESASGQALLIGGGIMAIFLVGLLVTVSFSNVGRRHEAHPEVADSHRQHSNKHGVEHH